LTSPASRRGRLSGNDWPMLFYKYQKPENLDFSMLRQSEVYFASVGELNDANECRPRFILKGSEELWQRLAQFILKHACFGSDYFQLDKKNDIRQIPPQT
jgi:hypothetical protein